MAFAKVQSARNPVTGAGSLTVAQAFASNVTAGNLIDVWVTWTTTETPTPSAPTSCTDALGNTYTHVANCLKIDDGNDQAVTRYYCVVTTGGACTPTVTFGASRANRGIRVAEFSGNHATPLDQSGGQYEASSTARSSGNVTTTTDGQLVVSDTIDSSAGSVTITPESTAMENNGAGDGTCGEWEVQTSAGIIAGDFTFSAARTGCTNIVTYKAAAGGGSLGFRSYYAHG